MFTNIKVIKKSGDVEQFSIDKMIDAIQRSASEIGHTLTESERLSLQKEIYTLVDTYDILVPQDLHTVAIRAVKAVNADVAKSYIDYHNKRQSIHTSDLNALTVVHPDGRKEPFDINKIFESIQKSAERTDRELSKQELDEIAENIANYSKADKRHGLIATHDVHRLVMGAVNMVRPDVFIQYRNYYRQQRQEAKAYREIFEQSSQLRDGGFDNENANKDTQIISTRAAKYGNHAMKQMFINSIPRKYNEAHDAGYIYLHDEEDLFKDTFNCDLVDLRSLMHNKEHEDGIYAFKINGKKTYEPNHIDAATRILGSVTINLTSQQFGGLTINQVDNILAEYAEKSYQHHLKQAHTFDIPNPESYAERMTIDEIVQGIQGYTYELAHTQNALGQTPFTTISFGLDTSKWGRIITQAILYDRMLPKGATHPLTGKIVKDENYDVFPKLVFMYRTEVNGDEDSPNYDLFQLSLECSSRKLYPDYLSFSAENVKGEHYRRDVYERSGGQTIAPMGCRAHLSPYIDPETGQDVTDGRFNIGAVSINPVKIALESYVDGKFDKATFDELVEKYANLIFDFLDWRYERVGSLTGSSNPLFWQEGGAWQRIGANQKVADSKLLDSATASIGYCGLYEMVNAMHIGDWESVTDDERIKIQEDFLNHINKIREERSKTDNHLYALYSTPAESLVYTWEKLLTKQYGRIDGVTDREYLTNSFHYPVWLHTDALGKIDYEKSFHQIARGGHISYAEFDYGVDKSVLEDTVKYAMREGLYFGVNVVSSLCNTCGMRGDFLHECPEGHTTVTTLQRVCGYLSFAETNGVQRVNDGKAAEIEQRVKHGTQRGGIGGESYAERKQRLAEQ